MRAGLSQFKSPALSVVLVVSILLGSAFVLSDLCIASGPDHPTIALDLCHPIQSLIQVSTATMAYSQWSIPECTLYELGSIPSQPRVKIINLNFAPDPPPPKASI